MGANPAFVQRNASGDIIAVFSQRSPTATEMLEETDPELVAYRAPQPLLTMPSEIETIIRDNPVLLAIVARIANLERTSTDDVITEIGQERRPDGSGPSRPPGQTPPARP